MTHVAYAAAELEPEVADDPELAARLDDLLRCSGSIPRPLEGGEEVAAGADLDGDGRATRKFFNVSGRFARWRGSRTSPEPVPAANPQEGALGVGELATAVRAVVRRGAGWPETAQLVASELERHLPSPDVLTPAQRKGDEAAPQSHVLHIEPDGAFSIVALVWLPGQITPIHDHVTWCVFGVIQGIEYEELFTLDEANGCLVEAGKTANCPGDVSGFAPPGDIHRVRNLSSRVGISIHVYGTDVSRVGSSVRRYYDLPVRSARLASSSA
jgi:predicted metal-dependent enzyme (double-stranded beta helix superfamily)